MGIPDLSRLSWVPGAYVRLGRRKTARPKTQDKRKSRQETELKTQDPRPKTQDKRKSRHETGVCSWMGGGWSAMRVGSLALPFAQQAGCRFSVTGWMPAFHHRLEARPTRPAPFASSSACSAPPRFVSFASRWREQAGSPLSMTGWKPILRIPSPLRLPPRALRLRVSFHSLLAGANRQEARFP